MELAVAVVLGAAFGAIVASLVDDIMMPIIGLFLGGVDFTGLSVGVGEAQIMYGNFIQATITFLIIAWVIFWIVKSYNAFMRRFERKQEEAPAEVPPPPREQVLLQEIRDLLAEQNRRSG
jgi:large conductance mechanosensitive channel